MNDPTGYKLFNKELRQDIRETHKVLYGKNPTHQEITQEVNNIWNNLSPVDKDIWKVNAIIKSGYKL